MAGAAGEREGEREGINGGNGGERAEERLGRVGAHSSTGEHSKAAMRFAWWSTSSGSGEPPDHNTEGGG